MDYFISRKDAKKMITLYRAQMNTILNPAHQGQDILVFSETFDRGAFEKILGMPGVENVRIYYGMSEDLKIHAIIVGADANGRDVLMTSSTVSESITSSTLGEGEEGEPDDEKDVIEQGTRCPPLCPEP